MLKHSQYLSTIDQELFPGIREEKDTKLWLLRKWVFAIAVSLALVYWSGPLWKTPEGRRVQKLAEKTSLRGAAQTPAATRTAEVPRRGVPHGANSGTEVTTSTIIPRGTLIPVEIEYAEFEGLRQARIVARAQSYVFPDTTVLIPAGSEIRGTARREGDKWEIQWNSVSVVSIGGRHAAIQAMNEIPTKASLDGRSLLVRAN